MRVFTDAAAAAATGKSTSTAANTGGYNDAMDYAPVQVGYWNCQYPRPSDNATTGTATEYGGVAQAAAYFGLTADLSSFGGQARCASCRCMTSSLMELTKVGALNPSFPQYGLCYRTNCYRPDYLQVGIKAPLGSGANWYACPAAGGKLYVPGFAGALHCPAAADFCAHENVTGTQFPEANVTLEWAFWGTLLGAVAILFVAMLVPAVRNRLVNGGKACCGARVFEAAGARRKRLGLPPLPGDEFGDDEIEEDDGIKPLPVLASRLLLGINGLAAPAGVAIFGLSVYAIVTARSYSFLISSVSLGLLITVAGAFGVGAARARALHGPSCCALVYFFFTLSLATLLVFAVAYTLAYSNFTAVADKYYAVVKDALPAGVVRSANATRDQAVADVAAYLNAHATAAAGVGAGVAGLFAVALGAAGHIITLRVLNGMTIVFINYVMLAFGVLMVAVGGFVAAKAGVVGDAVDVVGLTLGGGALFLAVAAVGLAAAFRRSARGVVAYGALTLGLIALAWGCAYACVKRSGDVVGYVAGLDDKALGALASSLGLPVTKATIVAALQANLRQLGLAFGVVGALLAVLFVNVLLFFLGIRAWKAEVGQDVWGRELPAERKAGAKAAAAAFVKTTSGRFARAPVVLGGGGPRPATKGLVVRAAPAAVVAGADVALHVLGDNSAAPRAFVPKPPPGTKGAPPAGPRILG